ncbi:MAG: type II toxin-antitoxin system VapC family toxin [Thermoanaerobaculia bacterium]
MTSRGLVLVDTSVWVDLFRDKDGSRRKVLRSALRRREVVLARFHAIELLQGARDEDEWQLLEDYLGNQHYLEMSTDSWVSAARIYFDLRRLGRTVRSTIDCCIAALAIESGAELLHRDRDFSTIAEVRELRHRWLSW